MLSRRSFFSRIFKTVAAVVLPVAVVSFDPIKQKVCKSALAGFKQKEFFEPGIVYAPYIPLYVTSEWVKVQTDNGSYYKEVGCEISEHMAKQCLKEINEELYTKYTIKV